MEIFCLAEVLAALVGIVAELAIGLAVCAAELLAAVLSIVAEIVVAAIIKYFESRARSKSDEADSTPGPATRPQARWLKLCLIAARRFTERRQQQRAGERLTSETSSTKVEQTNAELLAAPNESWRQLALGARKWSRRLTLVSATVFGVSVVGIIVADVFFLDTIVGGLLRRSTSRSQATLSFDDAEGSLLLGGIQVNGVRLQRTDHSLSDYDLRAQSLRIEYSLTTLLARRNVFDAVRIRGVRGRYHRRASGGPIVPQEAMIRDFELSDVQLNVTDDSRKDSSIAINVAVDSLTANDLRYRWLAFDVLFRSQLTAELNGGSIHIDGSGKASRGKSTWTLAGLPTTLPAHYLGGVFAWVTDGTAALHIESDWEDTAADINTLWHVEFTDLHAQVPSTLSLTKKAAAVPVVALLNRFADHFAFDFRAEFRKSHFEDRVVLSGSDLKDIVTDAAMQRLVELSKAAVDKVRDAGAGIRAKFNKLRERFRRKKQDDDAADEP